VPDLSSSLQGLYKAGGKNFSFSGRPSIFNVEPNGTLVLSGIHVTGVAFAEPPPPNTSQLLPDGLVGYPSISCYQNCQV
jgi:hypothetical protein